MTIPKKAVPILEKTMGVHLEKSESIDIIIEFNQTEYHGRINRVNIISKRTECHQIYWKGVPSLAQALQQTYDTNSVLVGDTQKKPIEVEIFGIPQSRRIIIKPKAPAPELDL